MKRQKFSVRTLSTNKPEHHIEVTNDDSIVRSIPNKI